MENRGFNYPVVMGNVDVEHFNEMIREGWEVDKIDINVPHPKDRTNKSPSLYVCFKRDFKTELPDNFGEVID